MPTDIQAKVGRIAILMLENRSFDHMLGYLSLTNGANRTDIDGITSLKKDLYVNTSAGDTYRPFLKQDAPLPADLPHGRKLVDVQLKFPDGEIRMEGFVEAYRQHIRTNRVPKPAEPMALHEAPLMLDYFAANHMVCDRWFAPLPTDTQPNRLMALSGFTTVDDTSPRLLKQRPLIFDWLNEQKVKWRVYRSSLPFETLMPHMWDDIFDEEKFRSVKRLAVDVSDEPDTTFPRVIFIEPSFQDVPINFGFPPNDDHPPLPVGPGQQFMRDMYMSLNASDARWKDTVLIVTYDEHGGFYDHVPPLSVRTDPPAGAAYPAFTTTGVRVPAIIASPLVKAGSVCKQNLDHTSILQFIAERFGDGSSYSPEVDARREQGIGSVSQALNRDEPRERITWPREVAVVGPAILPAPVKAEKKTKLGKAFEAAATQLLDERREDVKKIYPELILWERSR